MHKLKIELTEAQFKAANTHATDKGLPVEVDLVKVWWGRVAALDRYAEKRADPKAKFNPHLPLALSPEVRNDLKAKAGHAPKAPAKKREPKAKPAPKAAKAPAKPAPVKAPAKKAKADDGEFTDEGKPIEMHDGPAIAVNKAIRIAQFRDVTMLSVLKAAGRDAKGERLK